MYDPQDDALFGHDMRHKPPITVALTDERGWGGSRGRLAYDRMNRQQDNNMSEYAIRVLGMMPKGYVIINDATIDYNPDTALRVGHHRVAIPVKELARELWLTIQEQWELMNPNYIGTYFNLDSTCSKRPEFDEAYQDAIAKGETDKFLAQFWIPEHEYGVAIYRLRLRLDNLEDERMTLKMRMNHKEANVKRIKSDIAFQRVHLYNNIQKSLWKAEEEFEQATNDYYKHLEKIDKLKTYLKLYTIR